MSNSRHLARSALAAALLAVGALIAVPIGPVPVTLQVLVLATATLLLSPAELLTGVCLYLAIGAFGAPVFSGGSGGIGVLLGPTGGFLWGFLAGAPVAAMLRRLLSRERHRIAADLAALLVLLTITYSFGVAQFVLVSGRSIGQAFALAVAPFVLIDLGKAVLALAVARGVRAAGLGDA